MTLLCFAVWFQKKLKDGKCFHEDKKLSRSFRVRYIIFEAYRSRTMELCFGQQNKGWDEISDAVALRVT
jgi:hypothetical protein